MSKFKSASKKKVSAIIAVAIILNVTLIGSIAYLIDKTEEIVNIFNPGTVTTDVEEEFENNIKSSIKVKNTGNTESYVRVALVAYRVEVDADGNVVKRIGGNADVPSFELAANWVKYGDHYYYTLPVPAGGEVELLASPITLQSYDDADGGVQAIDVMASGIQANPAKAVNESWGVVITPPTDIEKGSVSEYEPPQQ